MVLTPGSLNALIAFGLWGCSPLFWKQLSSIEPSTLIAWRIILTFLTIAIIIFFQRKREKLSLKNLPKKELIFASLLISSNWFLYVYAVNNSKVLQGSLGYFMGPILSFLLGMIILREKIFKTQFLSLLLFSAGVFILSYQFGLPLLSLSIGGTFALYGLCKKRIALPPQYSLFFETLLALPLCCFFLLSRPSVLGGLDLQEWFFFLTAGLFTYLPLHYFAKAAREIPLTHLGVFQYIAPFGQFFIGLFWYNEPFGKTQLIAYSLIWLGIVVFTSAQFLNRLKSR